MLNEATNAPLLQKRYRRVPSHIRVQNGDKTILVPRETMRLFMAEWYRAGKLSDYEVVKQLYNMGFRGWQLDPRIRMQ